MTQRTRTSDELKSKLAIQLRQLTKRCDAYYEDGDFFEAYSTATIARVLVHDTRESTSLLKMMGLKDTTKFLHSRVHDNLYMMGIMNGYSGLHPRTRSPYTQYSDANHVGFDEWWQGQSFKVTGIDFTRKELVAALANKEGGAHVDENPDPKLDVLNRSTTPYLAIEGDDHRPMYGAELASMCAIGEELLFSLTPEPENRKRMSWEPWQGPYYLTKKQSDAKKQDLMDDRLKLGELLEAEADHTKISLIQSAISSLDKKLAVEIMTSDDYEVRLGVAQLMKMADVEWGV